MFFWVGHIQLFNIPNFCVASLNVATNNLGCSDPWISKKKLSNLYAGWGGPPMFFYQIQHPITKAHDQHPTVDPFVIHSFFFSSVKLLWFSPNGCDLSCSSTVKSAFSLRHLGVFWWFFGVPRLSVSRNMLRYDSTRFQESLHLACRPKRNGPDCCLGHLTIFTYVSGCICRIWMDMMYRYNTFIQYNQYIS